jgi:hypothetical protein
MDRGWRFSNPPLSSVAIRKQSVPDFLPEPINSLRTDGDFCHQGHERIQKLPKKLRSLKYTDMVDMTIHWKALVEHFLMVQC